MALPKGLPQVSDINTIGEILDNGFQAFIDEKSNVLTASSSMPAGQLGGSGVFRSSVVGRAPITDISQDLKASMGVERIPVQSIYQLQDEFGPNGEPVYSALNDSRGLIRFIGSWVDSPDLTNGRFARSSVSGNFIEITFYGTGLNLNLNFVNAGTSFSASIDGNTAGSNLYPASISGVLAGRNYATNIVLNVASNLSLGIHTIKISANTLNTWDVYGFEVLNESSTLAVNSGVAYIKGQKYTTTAAQSLPYNSTFESGSLTANGGRVLVYQKSDGSIAKAAQPVPLASPQYLSSANHQLEEVARTYHWREFGAGRADDFSIVGNGNINVSLAFTLDDGTTTLIGSPAAGNGITNQSNTLAMNNVANAFISLTFVGTGLDVSVFGWTNSQFTSITIDGTALAGVPALISTGTNTTFKICSGLPYGTHTVKFSSGASLNAPGIKQFIVYQPKKPSLPSAAVELADYNVMADYVANTTAGQDTIATGILRKHTATREAAYIGTVSGPNLTINQIGGFNTDLATLGGSLSYTFFGTGFELRGYNLSPAITVMTVDNTFVSAGNVTLYGGSMSYNATNGQISGTGAANGGITVKNLALGLHTVKFAVSTAGDFISHALDIITPIHSPKSSLYADLQNTLPVGSCAISDNRKTSAIKEGLPAQKAWAKAVGVSSSPSTTSNVAVPMPDMSVTIKTNGGRLRLTFNGSFNAVSTGNFICYQFYVNGIAVDFENQQRVFIADNTVLGYSTELQVSAGIHKVDLYWRSNNATTLTAPGVARSMIVEEL